MSRLLFILFILAMVCVKLCVGSHDESTIDVPTTYCSDGSDSRKCQGALSDSARYADNSMPTGHTPYHNAPIEANNNSKITITNDSTDCTDAVVIVKRAGKIVRNSYVAAGDTAAIYVPNGTYTVYIYKGKGWHSEKAMPRNHRGGFVAKERFISYAPVSLSYCTHDFDIARTSGQCVCSANEVFGACR